LYFNDVFQALDSALDKSLILFFVDSADFGREEELDDGILIVKIPCRV